MAQIHVLDQHFANQIAAGEVVERPVSVVKELVENALDAGATDIQIVIEGNGTPLIKVIDNGEGIGKEDLPIAVLRHATSKISSIDDLNSLKSLGFRGEALPSIASVSRMEIISRQAHEISGMSIKLEGGKQIELKEVGCPPGTTVIVRDLFFNTPARLKFLRSTNTEFGLITDMVGRLALAHPYVRFTLSHPQQIVFQTTGRGLKDAASAVFGLNISRALEPIKVTKGDWAIEGLISPPSLVRSSRQAQTFIVNGRIIRSSHLSKALEDGYHTLISNKTYPIAVLHIHLPPHEYDVNVHPTKMEIRFHKERELFAFLSESVRNTLLKGNPIPTFDFAVKSKSYTDFQKEIQKYEKILNPLLTKKSHKPADHDLIEPLLSQHCHETKSPYEKSPNALIEDYSSHHPLKVQQTLPFEKSDGEVTQSVTINNTETVNKENEIDKAKVIKKEENTAPAEESSILHRGSSPIQSSLDDKSFLKTLWPIGQVFNTYILATDGNVLAIIDQHAAHERINYEKLLKEVKNAPRLSQDLLIPVTIEFTLEEEQVLLDKLWFLREMGFVFEHFGQRTYLIRSVPYHAGFEAPENVIREFIHNVLTQQGTLDYDELLSEWIYSVSCKQSIKAKEGLSLLDAEQLLSQLTQTDNPFTCPHGRPTVIKLTKQEIEKRFYRT